MKPYGSYWYRWQEGNVRRKVNLKVTDRRAAQAAVAEIAKQRDRRHVRRALTPDELARLIAAARVRPLEMAQEERVIAGVSDKEKERLLAAGAVRALVYRVGAGTGLRRGEMQRVRRCDIDLDRSGINVPAVSAKNRKDQWVPLRADLVEALREHLAAAEPGEPLGLVFPRSRFPNIKPGTMRVPSW